MRQGKLLITKEEPFVRPSLFKCLVWVGRSRSSLGPSSVEVSRVRDCLGSPPWGRGVEGRTPPSYVTQYPCLQRESFLSVWSGVHSRRRRVTPGTVGHLYTRPQSNRESRVSVSFTTKGQCALVVTYTVRKPGPLCRV